MKKSLRLSVLTAKAEMNAPYKGMVGQAFTKATYA